MPRLNIYIPDELDLALRTHHGDINVSRVCAEALRAALSARADIQSIPGLFTSTFENPSAIEEDLMVRYDVLRRAIVANRGADEQPGDVVAFFTGCS